MNTQINNPTLENLPPNATPLDTIRVLVASQDVETQGGAELQSETLANLLNNISIATSAGNGNPIDANLAYDPATGELFYRDASGNQQPFQSGDGITQTTAANNGSPLAESLGLDPATGELFFRDANGDQQQISSGANVIDTVGVGGTTDAASSERAKNLEEVQAEQQLRLDATTATLPALDTTDFVCLLYTSPSPRDS